MLLDNKSFACQFDANSILLKSAAIRRKEAVKQRQQSIICILSFALLVPLTVQAVAPKPKPPEPCSMTAWYIAELEAEKNKKEFTQKKLREARNELKLLKQKEQQLIKITTPNHISDGNSISIPRTGFPDFFKSAWDSAIETTLRHEGGLVLDSNGYMANFGINQAYYQPLKGFPKRVSKLTKSQAKACYKTYYWNPLKLEDKGYSKAYQMFIFDAAVNSGVGYAQKLNKKAKGNLSKAKALRAAHCTKWAAASPHNRKYLKGLIARIHTYKEGKIV